MRAAALRVPRAEGERLRRWLSELGQIRTDLGVDRDTSWVYLPLRNGARPGTAEAEVVDHEFSPRRAPARPAYRDLVALPEASQRLLPRSFDVVGDVVVVRLPPSLSVHAPAIGAALLAFVPGARVVANDAGVVGESRIRQLQTIAGAGSYRTEHRENGLVLAVDPTLAYFSPRLAREHARVADECRPGERVLDLCCGVGSFALTMARRQPSAIIEAVDSNPHAVELLRENIHRLRTPGVSAVCADAESYLARAGEYHRAVLNLPRSGARFLPALGLRVRPGGELHFYEVTTRARRHQRPAELAKLLSEGGDWRLEETHVVHEYSPASDLLGYRFKRGPGGDP